MLKRIDRYKAALDAVRPFEGETLTELRDYYKIGLTWSSNALEGNTLTISETKVVLEDGLTVGGKPLRDIYETTGHGAAYDYMFSLLQQREISVEAIRTIHRLFYQQVDPDQAGRWRNRPVIVTGTDYVFPAPKEVESLMEQLEVWIKEERDKLHPITFAAMLHLQLVSIHPFIDGNGRTSRLVMNLALLQDGYQLAVIPPICRADYLATIRRYQLKGDSKPFVDFIAERVLESEKDIMRMLHIPFPREGGKADGT